MSKIKVLHLSTNDINSGAGVVPYNLHKALSGEYSSTLVVKQTDSKEKGVISYCDDIEKSLCLKQKIWNRIKKWFKLANFETDPMYYYHINDNNFLLNVDKLFGKIEKPDIIIVYFMHGLFTFETLYELQQKTKAPIFLEFVDMVYLAGGCHYQWDCDGYKSSCENCPAIIDEQKKYLAADAFKRNLELIRQMDIVSIPGADGVVRQMMQSTIFKEMKIEKILLGLDPIVFHKKPKNELRKKYNIPTEKFVLLYGAVSQLEKRKGWKYLVEALHYLKDKIDVNNLLLLSIGNKNRKESLAEFHTLDLGYIKDEDALADVYNIADMFVVPSIQDAGPSMINQSIACGTPVVSFKVGVSKDLVIDGETGYRADLYDSESLAEGISKIYKLDAQEYEKMSLNCLKIAKDKTSLEVQVKAHHDLIQKTLKQ